MSIQIKFVNRPDCGRPRMPAESFDEIMEALLSEPTPTEWADLRDILPHVDVREAFLRRLRRKAVIATSGAGRYVKILRLK